MDNLSSNVIYINNISGYSPLELYTTLAHEGYPGHLYQTVYSGSVPSNEVRSILNFGGYVEGWATYVEMYSYSTANGRLCYRRFEPSQPLYYPGNFQRP